MRIGEALNEIKSPKYGMMRTVSLEEKFRYKGDLEKIIKSDSARKLAYDIVESDKLQWEKHTDDNGDEHHRAEVYILTHDDIETLILNVERHVMLKAMIRDSE